MWLTIAAVFAAGVCVDLLCRLLRKRHTFRDKHVLVTGGSAGIGKALAAELLARGARVTILARTEAKLVEAVAELKSGCKGVAAVRYSCANIADGAALEAAISAAEAEFGPVDALICNAGSAAPGLFLEMPVETFATQMDVNYLGTVRTIKAVVPQMVQRRKGQVIIVSSALAVVSFLGYSSYAPTKHALRGLADALRNELIGFGIAVHIAYPPDTDTPGFAHENETKPPETSAMVPADAYSPSSVAKCMLNGAAAGLFHLPSPDALQNVLVSAAAGVTPRAFPFLECCLLPLAGLLETLVATCWFDRFGHKYAARHTRAQDVARQTAR